MASVCPMICNDLLQHIDNIPERRHEVRVTIDHLDDMPSYEEFFLQYLLPNRPCVMSAKCTEGWRSRREWVQQGRPHLDFFISHFGSATVPVADCSQEKFSSHPKEEMSLKDYFKYWKEQTASPGAKCLYLKDWHFNREFPEYKAYTTPVYFRSDWLNEFWDTRTDERDDYQFVYIGPKGSWTPLHADVFRSYSWSANICGRKKWIFFPPGEEKCLTDVFGQLVYDVTSSELADQSRYPSYKHLQHRLEVYQEEGEIIFVPSGWHHQVFNVEDTISINHNWLNGCNIDICWAHIQQCLREVQKEIADCRDMDGWQEQCQLILKASSGINYIEFLSFLTTIAQHRLHALSRLHVAPTPLSETDSLCTEKTNCVTNVTTSVINSADQATNSVINSADLATNSVINSADLATNSVINSADLATNSVINSANVASDSVMNSADWNSVIQSDIHKDSNDSKKILATSAGEPYQSENSQSSYPSENNTRQPTNSPTSSGGTTHCTETTDIHGIETSGAPRQINSAGTGFTDSNVNLDLLPISCDTDDTKSQFADAHWRYCNTAHAKFDLMQLRDALTDILSAPEMSVLEAGPHMDLANQVLRQIKILCGYSWSLYPCGSLSGIL
ncbi:2-oxoglutarate and iron-dependent oxygenase JMJD4-like [Haliotis rubra]|uniref:2-oxoglutarate and iron-dependent oxygenase JMJD4-like n=1 Tax=Haliotis rubra TaxID=36100 RepID=UPI001EE5E9EB|nr:2-oxoglutarate and iron-dependent oxygenase JMJD4-like [Haliotis rubra]